MNARILELAKKSGIDIYGLGKDREKWERCLEEFAGLIANECSQIAMNQHNSDSFDLCDDLEPLGEQFEAVLFNNLWDLYED